MSADKIFTLYGEGEKLGGSKTPAICTTFGKDHFLVTFDNIERKFYLEEE